MKRKNGQDTKVFKMPIKTSKVKKKNETEVKESRIINKPIKNTRNRTIQDDNGTDSEKKLENNKNKNNKSKKVNVDKKEVSKEQEKTSERESKSENKSDENSKKEEISENNKLDGNNIKMKENNNIERIEKKEDDNHIKEKNDIINQKNDIENNNHNNKEIDEEIKENKIKSKDDTIDMNNIKEKQENKNNQEQEENNITLNHNGKIIVCENKNYNLVKLEEKKRIEVTNNFETFNNNIDNIEKKIDKINDSFINQNQLPELNSIVNPQILNKSHTNFFPSEDIQVGEK